MISLFMSTPVKKQRHMTLAARILVALLAAGAVICLSVSGMYAYRILNRDENTEYIKVPQDKPSGTAHIDNSQTGTVLGRTADAGKAYIDETLFLGDSNTVRFMTMTDDDETAFTSEENTIAVVGMGAEGITSVPCEQLDWAAYTMAEAVSILQPRRIIMTFGTNNLDRNTMDADLFIEMYEPQIKAVREAYPYADLIINSIPPCAEETIYPIISIEQIKEYNKAILAMCEKNSWKYLNSFEALSYGAMGYGRPGYFEYDGIHLTEEGIKALFSYIRTHAWIKDDDRPLPLDPLPYSIVPITEIYTTDPLNNQPFDESVLHPETVPAYTAEPVPETAPVPEVTEPDAEPEVPSADAETPEEPAPQVPAEGEPDNP